MKKIFLSILVLFSLSMTAHAFSPEVGYKNHGKPINKGYLKVSDLHEIYYEVYGNPKGIPAITLHGGPGVGFSQSVKQAFDPKKFQVVLFDQRGAGRSHPQYELTDNNTKALVEDIEKLRKHLGYDKVLIFGGSWGSTLALAYAETYPENVRGIVMRGVFLGTEEEDDHFYKPGGVDKFFPEVYEKVTQKIKPGSKEIDKKLLVEYIQSDDPATSKEYADLWSWYEIKITNLEVSDEIIDTILKKGTFSKGLALIENHYARNKFFLKKNQLIKNADKLKEIPIIMVAGRYDMITPPIAAYRLHKMLPGSKLWIVESASHTSWEPKIANKLLAAVEEFKK